MNTKLAGTSVWLIFSAVLLCPAYTALGDAAVETADPNLHDGLDYGQLIAGTEGNTAVWWCPATHKVPRKGTLPRQTTAAATLEAARHDYEAFQIVVRPEKRLARLTAAGGPLRGPDGATIDANCVKILRVYYHFVENPTDRTGRRGYWPDALPPLDHPVDVAAGQNQPLWVVVYVPKTAVAGDYRGQIVLKAEGFRAVVPVRLHVWDFALPERNHLETAFGFAASTAFQYHQVKTEADQRRLLDMYFESFARHRISPYDPVPLDPIRVKFLPDADPPRAEVDFSAFDKEMARVIEKFHFTGYRLPIQGIGGGSFHGRRVGKIGKYAQDTPQYEAMFSSYLKQLEDHLREKGWLDMTYIYWFDEPAPKDYEFVSNGMKRLKRYAPGLRRMLTEEPNEKLLKYDPSVNIWCPISNHYRHELAQKRRASGEQFWWYVCCGPKAPYCTLFIDHPATELRVWHWQAWQRNIVGTLVWRANYWTSGTAFPDGFQNPYKDPMAYTQGYSVPKGTKRFWGNGDGRFIYPPPAAAVPGASGRGPVVQPPVSSIRWEMLREGVEDYEYLYLLRERLNRHRADLSADDIRQIEDLLTVPRSITRDMTTFTTEPAPIYTRRTAVARAIERLSK